MNNNSDSSHRSDTLSISNLHCNSPSNMSNVTCQTLDEEGDICYTNNDVSSKKDKVISKKRATSTSRCEIIPNTNTFTDIIDAAPSSVPTDALSPTVPTTLVKKRTSELIDSQLWEEQIQDRGCLYNNLEKRL